MNADTNSKHGQHYDRDTSSKDKQIRFFKSFDEAQEYGLSQMASHSYRQRLTNLNVIRKRTYAHLLLADGSWPPISRTITIIQATYL
jgi:hypothetical protein